LLDIALDAAAQLSDAHAVFDHDVQVDRGFGLADLDADALGEAGPGAAWDALADRAERAAAAGAHSVHSGNFTARLAGDLLHDAFGDRDLPVTGGQPVPGRRGSCGARGDRYLIRRGPCGLVHLTHSLDFRSDCDTPGTGSPDQPPVS